MAAFRACDPPRPHTDLSGPFEGQQRPAHEESCRCISLKLFQTFPYQHIFWKDLGNRLHYSCPACWKPCLSESGEWTWGVLGPVLGSFSSAGREETDRTQRGCERAGKPHSRSPGEERRRSCPTDPRPPPPSAPADIC